jgi:hypothetical protein
MIPLFGIIGTIFFLTVMFMILKKRPTWKGKKSKTFIAYSLLVIGYTIYVCIDHFYLKTKLGESGLIRSITPYLLAFQFLWIYKLSDPKKT